MGARLDGDDDEDSSKAYVGDSAEFHCKSRFMMEGHPIAQCGPDGEWSNE